MIDKNRLREAAAAFDIPLDAGQLDQLDLYAALLVQGNEKVNLTAITQPQDIENKHFLDCLLLAACPVLDKSLVDVGSGAGFPGLVVKIFRPALPVTLMEPNGKRLNFLSQVSAAVGAPVQLVKERGEEAARKAWRGSFWTAAARAVAPLPALCEYCLPLLEAGGHFVAMKTEAQGEVKAARQAIQKLGGALERVQTYTLPGGAARSLIVISKVADTPPQYPRAGGVIAKRPL